MLEGKVDTLHAGRDTVVGENSPPATEPRKQQACPRVLALQLAGNASSVSTTRTSRKPVSVAEEGGDCYT